MRYPKAKRQLTWSASAEADASGFARLRVPYATLEPNGDGWVAPGAARWTMGASRGELALTDAQVAGGGQVELRP